MKTATNGAQTTIWAALSPELDKKSGLYYRYNPILSFQKNNNTSFGSFSIETTHHLNICQHIYFSDSAKAQVTEEAKNKEVSEWLWKLSEKWTGLDGFGGKTKSSGIN